MDGRTDGWMDQGKSGQCSFPVPGVNIKEHAGREGVGSASLGIQSGPRIAAMQDVAWKHRLRGNTGKKGIHVGKHAGRHASGTLQPGMHAITRHGIIAIVQHPFVHLIYGLYSLRERKKRKNNLRFCFVLGFPLFFLFPLLLLLLLLLSLLLLP
jgi:hypothetical protein